ncbi:uncharacterized protein LOC106051707 [Biomphalaria glabrata]|uniref:Uncharacterized protein LOC106051707 n=1 Tax=Biomphalaria glabrata TaxID=6526 RepID=A0A9U8DUX3_BIOGL|nr:uncharacterized protein LOC106051707 [Biomphalaria glabrata]
MATSFNCEFETQQMIQKRNISVRLNDDKEIEISLDIRKLEKKTSTGGDLMASVLDALDPDTTNTISKDPRLYHVVNGEENFISKEQNIEAVLICFQEPDPFVLKIRF